MAKHEPDCDPESRERSCSVGRGPCCECDPCNACVGREPKRNPQDCFAGQGSRGEQIAGGTQGSQRSRVVQGDPGVPAAASGPRATDGAEGFPARNPRRNGGTSHAGATRSDVRSPTRTRTEVRSPTSTSTEVRSPTSTSTQAHTSGNVTVTGGAGAGAETHVTLVRPNPALILVHGNPRPPAEVERAWCKFHGKDRFTGKVRDVGRIPGAPDYTFALGQCVDVNLGRGWQKFSPRPWLVFSPKDQSLWIVADDAMRLGSGIAGADVHGITYEPQASSGKDPSKYRHAFHSPRPAFSPVGNPNYCRAIMLDGGVYRVDDWIRN